MESQLQRIGIFSVNDTITKYPDFDASYKVCEYYVYIY
jgi:hypothetical protein